MKAKDFKQARKDLGLTQRKLAGELGLSKKNGDVYIRKVENNRCDPSGLLITGFSNYGLLKEIEVITLDDSITNAKKIELISGILLKLNK